MAVARDYVGLLPRAGTGPICIELSVVRLLDKINRNTESSQTVLSSCFTFMKRSKSASTGFWKAGVF